MNSSNTPFCNLYNRKCDFSPLRLPGVRTVAPWFRAIRLRVDTLANSRLACRLPGVGNAASPSAGAMLGVLRERAGLPRCSGALRRVWSRIWRVRAAAYAAAQLRPHSASATAAVRRRIRRADGFNLAMAAWHGMADALR